MGDSVATTALAGLALYQVVLPGLGHVWHEVHPESGDWRTQLLMPWPEAFAFLQGIVDGECSHVLNGEDWDLRNNVLPEVSL